MNIKDIQEEVKQLREVQGWQDTSLEHRIVVLVSEVGELAKDVLRLAGMRGDENIDPVKENIGSEISDIVWNLSDVANLIGVDLEEAFQKKSELNRSKNWRQG